MIKKDILKVTKGELIIGNENLKCENFSKDTRFNLLLVGNIFFLHCFVMNQCNLLILKVFLSRSRHGYLKEKGLTNCFTID